MDRLLELLKPNGRASNEDLAKALNVTEAEVAARIGLPASTRAVANACGANGLAVAIPHGFEFQVRPRSGLALKHGVTVANAPGTIDSDYRGELKVILINLGDAGFEVRRGDRVAQLVLAPVVRGAWVEVATLDETARGEGGFGSTGGHARL